MATEYTHFSPSSDALKLIHSSSGGIGRSLGLRVKTVESMISKVRLGLDIKVIENLSESMGLSEQLVAQLALIPKRTLTRRKAEGKLHSDESDRIARIGMVYDEIVDMFNGDKSKASQWFTGSKKSLGGVAPANFVDTEIGIQEVRRLIGRIRHGVFS